MARIKLISRLVMAMCVVRHVGLHKLAMAFGSKADSLSSMRTIQRFLAGFKLDLSLIARLVFGMLPGRGPYVLSMDRTNWQSGSFDINALVLAVTYKVVAIPVLFKPLPKRGNSNTDERITIVDRFIALFGYECIDCLGATASSWERGGSSISTIAASAIICACATISGPLFREPVNASGSRGCSPDSITDRAGIWRESTSSTANMSTCRRRWAETLTGSRN